MAAQDNALSLRIISSMVAEAESPCVEEESGTNPAHVNRYVAAPDHGDRLPWDHPMSARIKEP